MCNMVLNYPIMRVHSVYDVHFSQIVYIKSKQRYTTGMLVFTWPSFLARFSAYSSRGLRLTPTSGCVLAAVPIVDHCIRTAIK